MNQLVSKRHNLWEFWNSNSPHCVLLGELVKRFPDDFKLSFYRSLNYLAGCIRFGVHTRSESLNRKGLLPNVPQISRQVTLHTPLHDCD